MENDTATCFCDVGYTGSACDYSDDSDTLAGYASSGNPIVIGILILLAFVVVVMVGGFTFNVVTGKRGLKAIPGYSLFRQKPETDKLSRVEPPAA
jgi:hypothetical protein